MVMADAPSWWKVYIGPAAIFSVAAVNCAPLPLNHEMSMLESR